MFGWFKKFFGCKTVTVDKPFHKTPSLMRDYYARQQKLDEESYARISGRAGFISYLTPPLPTPATMINPAPSYHRHHDGSTSSVIDLSDFSCGYSDASSDCGSSADSGGSCGGD